MPKLITCSNRDEKNALIVFLRRNQYPENLNKDEKRVFRRKAEHFLMRGDDICYKGRDRLLKVVFEYETDLMDHIIETEHASAHIGMNKMVDLINQKYYGIPKSRICDYVRSCEACTRYNSLKTIQPVYINDITKKYDRYMIDCVDLRRYTDQNDGYCWILNVIDTYTKYLWSFKLKNKTAESIKVSLLFIFNNFGVPISIQSDNGKEFKNTLLKETLKNLNILIVHGRPRNPKAQGQVERVNQTVKRWLAKKIYNTGGMRWIDFHDEVVHAYNRTIHRATSKSPFILFHGHCGFNSPLTGGEVSDGSNGFESIINQNTDDQDSYLDEINNPWSLEQETTSSTENDATRPAFDYQVESNNGLRDEVLQHFNKYKQKTIDNRDSNLVVRSVEVGDQVLIKKDFDMNPSTKRMPFESFYHDSPFTVIGLLNNNMIQLKNNSNNELKTVHKGVIKKL